MKTHTKAALLVVFSCLISMQLGCLDAQEVERDGGGFFLRLEDEGPRGVVPYRIGELGLVPKLEVLIDGARNNAQPVPAEASAGVSVNYVLVIMSDGEAVKYNIRGDGFCRVGRELFDMRPVVDMLIDGLEGKGLVEIEGPERERVIDDYW